MASQRQRDLDHLLDSAGAGVYDEETGNWSAGSDDESGWGLSSLTNVVKKAAGGVESVAKRGAGLTYGLAKRGASLASKPFVYAYKGVKYVGEKAMQLAMMPIRKVVNSFKGKMVSRKAKELANQRGLRAPGPTENAQALAWAKDYTKSHNSKLGPLVASMMGSPEASLMGGEDELDGVANFDEIEGLEDAASVMGLEDDEMGLAPLVLYPLIVLGAVGLAMVLSKLYSAAFAGHPDPNQTDPNAAYPGQTDPSMMDPNAAYPGQMNPSMMDPNAAYPGQMDPSMMDPNAAQDPYSSQDPYAAQDPYASYPPDYYPQG
jgi:hypothetical protein